MPTLAADQRLPVCEFDGRIRRFRRIDDSRDILVSTRRLLRDSAHRWAARDDVPCRRTIDHPPSLPATRGLVPTHRAYGTVTCAAQRAPVRAAAPRQDLRRRSRRAAHRNLPAAIPQRLGKIRMPRIERPSRSLAMQVKFAGYPTDDVLLDALEIPRHSQPCSIDRRAPTEHAFHLRTIQPDATGAADVRR